MCIITQSGNFQEIIHLVKDDIIKSTHIARRIQLHKFIYYIFISIFLYFQMQFRAKIFFILIKTWIKNKETKYIYLIFWLIIFHLCHWFVLFNPSSIPIVIYTFFEEISFFFSFSGYFWKFVRFVDFSSI